VTFPDLIIHDFQSRKIFFGFSPVFEVQSLEKIIIFQKIA